jgi:outer membrane protein with beta-barrel domain
MRRLLLAALLVACFHTVAGAQATSTEPYPKVEGFVGYSANGYSTRESSDNAAVQNISSLFSDRAGGPKGFQTSLTRNLYKYLGIKGDFSMYFNQSQGQAGTLCVESNCVTGQDFHVDSRALYLLGGPEFKVRNQTRLTPFAHTLFGMARSRSAFHTTSPSLSFADSHTRTGLAMAFGGGFDIRTSNRISIRSLIDYLPTRLGDADPRESGRQNHVRLSLGIVFH